ncbi:TetR/AcrR family transcriptional regulator [Microbacterium gorillae]|uniref:TetR/AcrR family transcriptional regulator n=1 Tax=Microbacterium gorillae TaxID=1231063 RepID=UPI00058DF691|nr:TetR/AcrR family transcriptional regulator [Microbacterium gorillae]
MARPPHAREKVLDAFEALIIDEGERAATMDATASRAGVSKGGLIYHFPSKLALEEGLAERLLALVDADTAAMRAAPGGVVDAFIRTSVEVGTPLDRALIAVGRLATVGSPAAIAALTALRTSWRELLREAISDETAVDLVMLVADGVYFNAALGVGSVAGVPDIDALLALLSRAIV